MTTREKLIEVARQLFDRKGIENTTISDIAEASNKGRRTIYTYFSNKVEIYNAVLESEASRIAECLAAIVDDPVLTPREKLHSFIMEHHRMGTSQAAVSAAGNSPEGQQSFMRSLMRLDIHRLRKIRLMVYNKECIILDKLLEQGIASGQFRADRALDTRHFLVQMLLAMNVSFQARADDDVLLYSLRAFADFITTDLCKA